MGYSKGFKPGFNLPLLRRFFTKVLHEIVPAALTSLLGGFLITQFQPNRPPEPVTVPVARASPEMMELLRDEHGLIVSFVKAQVANEKSANEKSANEAKQTAADSEQTPPRSAGEQTPLVTTALAPVASRPTMVIAGAPARPAASRAKAPVVTPVVGASLPPPAMTPASQAEVAPPSVAHNDDSMLAKTMGIKDHVVGATQRAVSAIVGFPSWFGAIGDRLGGENPNPRPPANLMSEF
jgi:hypothetical protein